MRIAADLDSGEVHVPRANYTPEAEEKGRLSMHGSCLYSATRYFYLKLDEPPGPKGNLHD